MNLNSGHKLQLHPSDMLSWRQYPVGDHVVSTGLDQGKLEIRKKMESLY